MQQIGRYQIVGELGKGAMGIVYRAVDPAIGRTVAIKAIRINALGDGTEGERLRERLFREAQSAGVLSHPNIVTIYDIAEFDGSTYIFMEFVNGPTLDRLVQNEGRLDKQLLLALLRQVAAALDYAHNKGIVHRDIKPANIMVHEGTTAKIADFGVAKVQSQQMTQTGVIMGTPNYMSPEQIQGHAVDGRADQFSLAVMAYELLTGERPFTAETMPTLLFKIVRDEPVPPQRLNPTLGHEIETVLSRALRKEPAGRYATCTEFIHELTQALAASTWQPLPAGASLDMPTVVDAAEAPTVVAVDGTPEVSPIQRVDPPAIPPEPARRVRPQPLEETEEPPRRRRAIFAIPALLLVGASIYLAQNWMSRSNDQPQPANGKGQEQQAQEQKDRPAPVGTPPAVPAPPDTAAKPDDRPAADRKGATPDAAGKRPPSTHSFQLSTVPPAASVVFDGDNARTCTTPCTLPLNAGRHTLVARLEGYRPNIRQFQLPEESELVVNLDRMTGRVYIRTEPPGAQVSVDGQVQTSRTPMSVTLPIGEHQFEVLREGSKPYRETVTVRDGAISNLDVNFGSAQ